MDKVYRFEVAFDDEAGVWYIVESNLSGIHTEAATLDELVSNLKILVPDLLDAIAECEGEEDGSIAVPLEVIFHTRTSGMSASA